MLIIIIQELRNIINNHKKINYFKINVDNCECSFSAYKASQLYL